MKNNCPDVIASGVLGMLIFTTDFLLLKIFLAYFTTNIDVLVMEMDAHEYEIKSDLVQMWKEIVEKGYLLNKG
ncbi:CLUMA_CG002989, isoform A [Clunio marinus]|uniref:CLUMA_CG002989, isoform A n=1 Tax=Clunio marinus TaxID=568069 RepID=A0A1J1HRX3_9DIPT|nr:CLUMA_CG002989, isoform A [Clunio marinus]